jgi:hypothetical protein
MSLRHQGFIIDQLVLTPVNNSTGILIICYISFRTINFSFILPYSFPVLRVIE